MDSLPIVSQVKSAVQFTIGDWDGARTTQDNFSKQCVLVSQVRSIIELAQGEKKAASDTYEEFYTNSDGLLKKTPILGHARGCLAYLLGDLEAGNDTMFQATKTTVGVAGWTLILHGGIAIGCAVGIFGQRVREVDFPETLRKLPQEGTRAHMKRFRSEHSALDNLALMEEAIDEYLLPFNPSFLVSPGKMFTWPWHWEASDDNSGPEVTVEQEADVEEEDDQIFAETRGRTRQISEGDERCRARSPSYEQRRRLKEWRQDMLRPRL